MIRARDELEARARAPKRGASSSSIAPRSVHRELLRDPIAREPSSNTARTGRHFHTISHSLLAPAEPCHRRGVKRLALVPLALSATTGCVDPCGDAECVFTESDWAVVSTLSPVPAMPVDTTNKYVNEPAAQRLGQMLFWETRYSGAIRVGKTATNGGVDAEGVAGKVSCVSCHDPSAWFVDVRSVPGNVSLGIAYTPRQSPTLVNVAYYEHYGLGGRQDTLWNQASTLPEVAPSLAGDRCDLARMLFNHYRAEYEAAFPDHPLPLELADSGTVAGARFPAKCKPKANAMAADGPWEMMPAEDKGAILRILANQGKAFAAYQTMLVSKNAPFDKYVAGDGAAISDEAKRGLSLFVGKAACVDCHSGPLFTDNSFHNLGVPQQGDNVPRDDQGRFSDMGILLNHPLNSGTAYNDAPQVNKVQGLVQNEADKGRFRTPMLRHIAKTGPYFHAGTARTLTDVVEYYNEGGGVNAYATKSPRLIPLGLTPEEVGDLVAFLETLTGEPVDEALRKDIRVMP